MSPVLEGLINDAGLTANGRTTCSVILTKVRIQSHEGQRSLLWILTFVRMTRWGGDDGDWFARAEPS